MAHKSGNTSGVSKSSSDWLNYTGFPGDVCVVFFNVLPRNKDAVAPNQMFRFAKRNKKAVVFTTVMTNAYQDQINAGFSKVCEIFKVCGIESLKYVRKFYTPFCYCGDISTPRNVMLNKTNCDWLFDMSVKQPHGRAKRISFLDFLNGNLKTKSGESVPFFIIGVNIILYMFDLYLHSTAEACSRVSVLKLRTLYSN